MKININSAKHLDECLKNNSDKIVVLKFTAKWCGPCRKLAPLLDKIAETQEDIVIAEISIDENRDLCEKYSVKSIPHCLVKSTDFTSEAIQGFKPDNIIEQLKLARNKKKDADKENEV